MEQAVKAVWKSEPLGNPLGPWRGAHLDTKTSLIIFRQRLHKQSGDWISKRYSTCFKPRWPLFVAFQVLNLSEIEPSCPENISLWCHMSPFWPNIYGNLWIIIEFIDHSPIRNFPLHHGSVAGTKVRRLCAALHRGQVSGGRWSFP